MRKVRRNKLRKTMSIPEVSLTPLIDTALTLLIIFMVTTPMMQSVIKVELPKAKAQASQDMNNESLMVALDGKGDIYLNKKKMTLEGLVEYLQKSVARVPKNNIVFIHKRDRTCGTRYPKNYLEKQYFSIKFFYLLLSSTHYYF